ncbi:MAG TPA: hypothetical protein VK752_11520 [Bryobacteraceae bacterium]|jgi:hypothetical protein|nr:hypothetical protein [Bryobacteraceae bacterium]
MLSFRRSAMLLVAAAMMIEAQPALTTIQDILYRADGTRFNGEIFISWNAFTAGDSSNIATAQVKLPIVNGVLKVQLVPTTTASAGANYQVTYNSQGQFQFSQVWAVPPSSIALQVSAVLVSSGTVLGGGGGGAGNVTGTIPISGVTGLASALAVLAMEGVGYAPGLAAVINASGQLTGATGNLGDCVRVDGSSGPCGGGGVLPQFSDGETPAGAINGTNTAFTLAFTPSPTSSVQLYLNGLRQDQGLDYTISGSTISFTTFSAPQTGDVLLASYRYGNPGNTLGTLTTPQVVCSSVGTSTSGTVSSSLATCTLPAGLLSTGDRVEVRYLFTHTGTTTGFIPQLTWGTTPVLSRAASAADTAFAGSLEFAIDSSTQPFSGQSWGSSLALATVLGSASVNTALSITITFLGQMAASTSDAVSLSSFTVIRYPAQVNP